MTLFEERLVDDDRNQHSPRQGYLRENDDDKAVRAEGQVHSHDQEESRLQNEWRQALLCVGRVKMPTS